MELQNKVALVLGAVKGIGKGIALSLADAGAKVAINYFDWEEELAGLKNDFSATSGDHLILKTNLLETESIPAMIDKVIDRFGRLDILINNIERGGWPVIAGNFPGSTGGVSLQPTRPGVLNNIPPHGSHVLPACCVNTPVAGKRRRNICCLENAAPGWKNPGWHP